MYPVTLVQDEQGQYVVTSPDVPEAITDGASQQQALREMGEALGAALAGYAIEGRDIPTPSEPEPGQRLVPVAPLVAAKLALRTALREEGMTNVALADRLGVTEGAVRRLVDPDHASRLDRVVIALAAIGRGLVVEDLKQVAA
ncbi:MAG: type II toxin-antitoxin system HicB family antitoxin [Xanthomonadaceae bacterium]|nr:type II toxin-antitoxin system HicB family antitoxin [Xanthomonadaceae bacterium]